MTVQFTPPAYDGWQEGVTCYGADGSTWQWQRKKGEPNRFAVTAAHIPVLGPLSTGLTPEEMGAMLLWLVRDPRCTKIVVEALPAPCEWIFLSAPPVPVEAQITQ